MTYKICYTKYYYHASQKQYTARFLSGSDRLEGGGQRLYKPWGPEGGGSATIERLYKPRSPRGDRIGDNRGLKKRGEVEGYNRGV